MVEESASRRPRSEEISARRCQLFTLCCYALRIRPKHGHYALAPKQLDLLRGLQSTEGKEGKSIDITSVVAVPDTIPEGKEVLPEGKEVGNYQTPLFATGLD